MELSLLVGICDSSNHLEALLPPEWDENREKHVQGIEGGAVVIWAELAKKAGIPNW